MIGYAKCFKNKNKNDNKNDNDNKTNYTMFFKVIDNKLLKKHTKILKKFMMIMINA